MGFPSLPRIELYDTLIVCLRPFRGNVGRAFYFYRAASQLMEVNTFAK